MKGVSLYRVIALISRSRIVVYHWDRGIIQANGIGVLSSNTRVLVDPAQDLLMPHQTVLLIYHPVDELAWRNVAEEIDSLVDSDLPVVLIREVQQPAGNTTFLENIEQTQTLRFGQTIVLGAVDDQSGSAELQNVLRRRGVPAAVVVSVGPEGTVELCPVR